jgi:hypothetical protein
MVAARLSESARHPNPNGKTKIKSEMKRTSSCGEDKPRREKGALFSRSLLLLVFWQQTKFKEP